MKYVKDQRFVAPRVPFSSLSIAVGRDVFQTGRRNDGGRHQGITKAPQNTQPLRSLFRKRSNVIFPRKIARKRYTEKIEGG